MGDARVLDAMVASFTGNYQVRVRRNAVAAEGRDDPAAAIIAERDRKLATQQAEREPTNQAREKERAADIAEIRATYDAALRESEANVRAPGLLGRLTGGNRAALTGIWSGSEAECASERLILFEHDGTGTVEWRRASDANIGLLPWRSGR